jgi:hypothetical protein
MKKTLLTAAAIVSAGVFAAACSGGSDSKTYTLSSGDYLIQGDEVTADTCWADPQVHNALTAIDLPVAIVSTNGETFLAIGAGITADILPPIAGTIDGNALSANGSGTAHITTACSLQFQGAFTGTLTADDEFDLALTVTLNAAIQNSSGMAASDCSAFAGEDLPGTPIPVPAAVSSNEQCSITMAGHVVPD